MKQVIVDALLDLVFDEKKGYPMPDHLVEYEGAFQVMVIHLLIQIRDILTDRKS